MLEKTISLHKLYPESGSS